MIELLVGQKGIGKTKKLAELANKRISKSDGTVVLIVKEDNLIVNLDHGVRLIDIKEYNIADFIGLWIYLWSLCGEL